MSAEASDMSSWLLMGLPGVAYLTGIADAGWTAIGLGIGTYLNWLIVAQRLRRYSIICNTITIPDFFSRRFKDNKNILMCISAIIILIFFIPYTASGFKAIGTLFSSLLALITMLHDHWRGCYRRLYSHGRLHGSFHYRSDTERGYVHFPDSHRILWNPYGWRLERSCKQRYIFSRLSFHDPASRQGICLCCTIQPVFHYIYTCMGAWLLRYASYPSSFHAIEEEKKLVLSRRIATVWVLISMCVAILIGIIGYGASVAGSIPMFSTSSQSETVIIQFAHLLGQNGFLLSLIAGVVLAGILACTMSTADSQLLTAASGVSQNLLQDFFKDQMSTADSMNAARFTVMGIAIVAVFLAWNPDSSVFTIVSFAWAGFGASFGPLVLFALFWRRTNMQGALAGMLTGGIMVFVWKYLVRPLGGNFNIYELLPAFILSCLAIIIVSLLTKEPSQEIYDEFDSVGK